MSTLGALFQRGGFTYRTVPDAIELLPKGLQHRATVAYRTAMRLLALGELDERATDRRMSELSGWSEGLIQSGLHALDVVLGKILRERGEPPLIERIRAHGRRTIVPAPLAGRGTPLTVPPAPPSEDRRDTTTDAASSSSLGSAPEDTGGAGEVASEGLIARACKLIRKATRGRIIDAVAVYGSEWVSRALDRVEERNRKPGNRPVESWGFVLNTLANWRKEGGPPPDVPDPAPPTTKRAATTEEVDPAEEEREKRLREAWGLLSEAQREEIRTEVRAANPGIGRWPAMLEPLCLAELERRQAAELPRAP